MDPNDKYNTFEVSGGHARIASSDSRHEQEPLSPIDKESKGCHKHLTTLNYFFIAIIVILLIVSAVLLSVVISDDSSAKTETISVSAITGLDEYLKAHCVLYRDTLESENKDTNGEAMTVIRNPVLISSPINIQYSPSINATTGAIEYFETPDSEGNLVPKPLCQTDFETSSYTMKNNDYSFNEQTCEYPLPLWMNETDILNLPRRLSPITHRITLTTTEVVGELEPGHTFEFFTYNGTVPGPPLRVRVGDWVDLTLINPNTSLHEHSVDFHAMNGPGGGAGALRADPGEQARTVWQATIPGMFIYHCASGWASDHISKGMYGGIIVEPSEGLPYSDMDIYIGQNEIYLAYPLVNNMGTQFLRPPPNLHNQFDDIKERYELSDVVMMNGAPFSLVHNPIRTTVGSVVRAFMVSAGPNHLSSFHLIGDSFDRVWLHGDASTTPQQNIQTTTVPPGACMIADWRHDTPGTFVLVDHALTRAFIRGNLGLIRACDALDEQCLSGESSSKYAATYTCQPSRYSEDTLMGNDDCLFCPWNRKQFQYSTVYNETDEIYAYLDSQCNISDRVDAWQGNESISNDTFSESVNHWRRNRYPGELQWNLDPRLRHSDPMIGNGRGEPDEGDGDDFDDSECVVNVGRQIPEAIQVRYAMKQNGEGQIKISNLNNAVVNGGWIAFGRGGDGTSTMIGSHVQTVIFNPENSEFKVYAHFLAEYGTPTEDDSNEVFPISNPSFTEDEGLVSFSFEVRSGDWIVPDEGENTVAMVIAVGQTNGGVLTEDMFKHFNVDIIYASDESKECLLGGSKM